MTRINTIDPKLLTDQHLMIEYRELPRVFGLAEKHSRSGRKMPSIDSYRMGAGHVLFFYDKLEYLISRQKLLIQELLIRGFDIQHTEVDCPNLAGYMNNWIPKEKDHQISLTRLDEKVKMKPKFYKFKKDSVSIGFYALPL